MSLTEAALLIWLIAQAIAILVTVIKLVAWISAETATTKQRLLTLEHQVDNDITGLRAVVEMKTDVATIKAQIIDLREDFSRLYKKLE